MHYCTVMRKESKLQWIEHTATGATVFSGNGAEDDLADPDRLRLPISKSVAESGVLKCSFCLNVKKVTANTEDYRPGC